jgi:DNA-binding CsgD family transcriptional regulator
MVTDAPLSAQVADAVADARRLLGLPLAADGAPGLEELDAVARTLVERLAQAGDRRAEAEHRAHQQRLEDLRRRCAGPATALERARGAVGRLRRLTSPSEMLTAAPRELCFGSDLDRVVLSAVRDGMMIAQTVHFRGEAGEAVAALQAMRANPVRLGHSIVETEMLRRRRATLVIDARTDPRVDQTTATIMGWDTYVAAPVAAGSSIIGLIHADRGRGSAVQAQDRDIVAEFANGLAQAHESASLRRALRHEREQMRSLLEWLNARSHELSDAAIELVPSPRVASPPPQPLEQAQALPDVLTRREAEILGLLADGKTNRAIAAELVISDGTVKFHVNGILRKLRVSNRAEAVSRYFSLLRARPRQSD